MTSKQILPNTFPLPLRARCGRKVLKTKTKLLNDYDDFFQFGSQLGRSALKAKYGEKERERDCMGSEGDSESENIHLII